MLTLIAIINEWIYFFSPSSQPIPDNVFIVAACNPHRGNSLVSHENWLRGSYYVRPLHPTLKLLMWDYGALDAHQERDYINAKMEMINTDMEKSDVRFKRGIEEIHSRLHLVFKSTTN